MVTFVVGSIGGRGERRWIGIWGRGAGGDGGGVRRRRGKGRRKKKGTIGGQRIPQRLKFVDYHQQIFTNEFVVVDNYRWISWFIAKIYWQSLLMSGGLSNKYIVWQVSPALLIDW